MINNREKIIEEIVNERKRQIEKEGFDEQHDDHHRNGELARAAACYAGGFQIANLWPWHQGWWKPKDKRRNLIKAAALLVAEIERLDRKKISNSDDAVITGCESSNTPYDYLDENGWNVRVENPVIYYKFFFSDGSFLQYSVHKRIKNQQAYLHVVKMIFSSFYANKETVFWTKKQVRELINKAKEI